MSQDPVRISPALEESLILAQIPAWGAATVALARRYAALLDEAAPAGRYRRPLQLLERVAAYYRDTAKMTPVEERALDEAMNTIGDALAQHSVASDLGPKLLAALERLNMTLTKTDAKPTTPEAPSDASSVRDELKAKRRERERGAQAVDTAAP